jgi:hypothetical protein
MREQKAFDEYDDYYVEDLEEDLSNFHNFVKR